MNEDLVKLESERGAMRTTNVGEGSKMSVKEGDAGWVGRILLCAMILGAVFWILGVYEASDDVNRGVCRLEVLIKTSNMNPITSLGYRFYINNFTRYE